MGTEGNTIYKPKCVLLISGKRKCGKDYIAEYLKNSLTSEKCAIVRISEPVKRCYANANNLNLEELMSDSPYKEQYRLDMINWSEAKRAEDPGYFCSVACNEAPHKPIWIVSDVRRKGDIKWFKQTFGELIKCIRINADESIRKSRGWVFKEGVDDVASECNLDNFQNWDLVLLNNDQHTFHKSVEKVLTMLAQYS